MRGSGRARCHKGTPAEVRRAPGKGATALPGARDVLLDLAGYGAPTAQVPPAQVPTLARFALNWKSTPKRPLFGSPNVLKTVLGTVETLLLVLRNMHT